MRKRELQLKKKSSPLPSWKKKKLVREPLEQGEVAPPSPLTLRACLMHKTIWLKIHNGKVAGCGRVGYHGALMHDGWKRPSKGWRQMGRVEGAGGVLQTAS